MQFMLNHMHSTSELHINNSIAVVNCTLKTSASSVIYLTKNFLKRKHILLGAFTVNKKLYHQYLHFMDQ